MISKKFLFNRIREICEGGWFDLKSKSSGAPGLLLEEMVGLAASNHDSPDAGQWELKFSGGNSLVTLCHKTPGPKGIVGHLIKQHGWIGKNGRPSFRHTIEGESDRGFNIVYDAGRVMVRHDHSMMPVPHWTEDDLTNAIVSKLRRLVLVTGKVRRGRGQVSYESAVAFEDLRTTRLMKALDTGLIIVDFDAYLKENGKVRDHGTKLRVKAKNLKKLYLKTEKIF